MADATFKGTTLQVLTEISSGTKIGANTKITITDNTYTAANLLIIIGATNNLPVILQKTAAGIQLSGNAANLVDIIEGVNKYTGPLTVNVGTISADNLNILAKGTTGKVTATLDPTETISQTTLTALKDVSSSDNITYVAAVATTVAGESNLKAFVALDKKISNANWAGVSRFDGTSADVNAIKAALKIHNTAVNITSGQISAADANALAKASSGIVSATIKSGSVKSTLAALKDVNPLLDTLDFTSTESTVNAKDLVALKAKLALGATDFTSITTITENAKDVGVAGKTVTDALAIQSADVKISGAIDTASAATIAKDANIGTFTATVKPDTAANLVAALNGTTSALALTLSDITVKAVDLNALDVVTTGSINANSVKTITATAAQLTEIDNIYTAAKGQINGLGNEIITITGAATVTAAEANVLAGYTSGKVVAAVTGDTATNLLGALTNANAKDELTLVVTGTSTAKDLLNLDGKTSVAVDATAVTTINGSAADIKKVFAAKGIEVDSNNVAIDVTVAASAAEVNALAASTLGRVTATIKSGSVASTLKALSNVDGAVDVITFTTTDRSVNAKDLVALDALVTTFNVASVQTITSKAADIGIGGANLTAAIALAPIVAPATLTAVTVTITNGNISAADAGAISLLTSGKVTATLVPDTAAIIATGLGGGAGTDALNVTVNGTTASVTDLKTINGATAKKIKLDAAEVTALNFGEFEDIYVTAKNDFSNLGDENIIVGGTVDAAQAEVVAKAINKVVTATISTTNAATIVSNLKSANAKDAFSITVTGVATAKDLLTLDGKTSVTVDASVVTTINGTVAEINKLFGGADVALNPAGGYVLSGTVKAADVNTIASKTTGTVDATIAADTAAKLNAALNPAGTYNLVLTVNGATASQADLASLATKASGSGEIKVDAKEITVDDANIVTLAGYYATPGTFWKNLGNENVKLTDAVNIANLASLNGILGKTTGIVTAALASTTDAAALNAGLSSATAKDALTLTVTGSATASDLLGLDDKTSVKVDASGITAISGSAADVKKLAAAKGVELANNVGITATGTTSAADLAAILKATNGAVTATVAADTAVKLNAALKDANSADALSLTVNGTTANASDLISLSGKTSVAIVLTVGAITGNIADITTVFTNTATDFNAASLVSRDATISGTVDATAVDTVGGYTSGIVTATVTADSATALNTALTGANASATDKLTLKVIGDDAVAADLAALDGKTAIAVDASAIKNIDGTTATGTAQVTAVINAAKAGGISGLGNETVTFAATTADADDALVLAINNFTTGLITLPTVTFDSTAPVVSKNFNLGTSLGDLNGITGLTEINSDNGIVDNITLSLNDILAANDTTGATLTFNFASNDADNVTLDVTGWTADAGNNAVITSGDKWSKDGLEITITADASVILA